MTEVVVILTLQDGRNLALPAPDAAKALRRAQDLGFGSPVSETTAPPASGVEPWVTVDVAAKHFAVTPQWIEQACKEKAVPCLRPGRYLRVRISEVERALLNGHADPRTARA